MAQCMYPYYVERKLYTHQSERVIPVPCGKCPQCLKRRVASWSFRLEIEALQWQKQYFVTLTYNTDSVPISPNTFMTLDPTHITKYLKRLRKQVGKLRYYLCGEYGTRFKRPHYHLILFGNSNLTENDIINSWVSPETKQSYGDVYFGKVEAASIRYTVQYYDKGDWRKAHQRDDRLPEFSRMSQGLGRDFLTEAQVNHFLNNPEKGYIYNKDGHKIAIPRYYKNRLYDYLSSDKTIANHPSILIHRDEMAVAKEKHHQAISVLMQQMEQPEETEELIQDRRAAINNYRQSKRKSRK